MRASSSTRLIVRTPPAQHSRSRLIHSGSDDHRRPSKPAHRPPLTPSPQSFTYFLPGQWQRLTPRARVAVDVFTARVTMRGGTTDRRTDGQTDRRQTRTSRSASAWRLQHQRSSTVPCIAAADVRCVKFNYHCSHTCTVTKYSTQYSLC